MCVLALLCVSVSLCMPVCVCFIYHIHACGVHILYNYVPDVCIWCDTARYTAAERKRGIETEEKAARKTTIGARERERGREGDRERTREREIERTRENRGKTEEGLVCECVSLCVWGGKAENFWLCPASDSSFQIGRASCRERV